MSLHPSPADLALDLPSPYEAERLDLAKCSVLLLANPTAGHGEGDEALACVQAGFKAAGVRADVHRTTGPGDARARAQRAAQEGVEALICIGGDGTLHEAINGLRAGSEAAGAGEGAIATALGLVPVGTGNDYARMLNVPGKDPAGATQVLLAGKTRRVDLGRMEGGDHGVEWFCNNVGIAFLAVANAAHEVHRYLPGRLSYSLGGFIEFLRFKARVLELEVDEVRLERNVFGVQLSVGRYCGGGIMLAPEATLADGRLHVCVIGAQNKVRTILEWPQIAKGRKLPAITVLAGREVAVRGAPGMLLHLDGEVRRAPLGQIRTSVEAAALRIVCG